MPRFLRLALLLASLSLATCGIKGGLRLPPEPVEPEEAPTEPTHAPNPDSEQQ